MAGVSGDLYDFYLEDNVLTGVSILDVSGHGIASGLITMLARTIFYRNFAAGKEEDLSEILEKSNRHLIKEIGNVDYYLTGILLRFKQDSVEYVNAAGTTAYFSPANLSSVTSISNDGTGRTIMK